jgi:6-phosphogluconolactonase
MKIQILADAQAAARAAAAYLAAVARAAVRERGRFILAVSGGRTPWHMLRLLADLEVPWETVHLFQVDERLAPLGDPDRNLTHLQASLPSRATRIYPMPVESEDFSSAADRYAQTLREVAGEPPVLDLVHLGLGPDGHTASLLPHDPVLKVTHRDVALTVSYQGRRRLTLTYPILNRARGILWLVTGKDKARILVRLLAGDRSIPAGRIQQDQAVIIADQDAAVGVQGMEES